MKNKIITFFLAMGIPVSAITTRPINCSGLCGTCNFNCFPGVLVLLLLGGKYIYSKLSLKGAIRNE